MSHADSFQVEPLEATFGARVTGIDLRTLSQSAFDALYRLWVERGLLIFPGQHLTPFEQGAFAERFGPLEFPVTPLSNVDRDGKVRDADDDVVKVLRGNMGWHHDSTYMPVQARGAVFTAHRVPPEGGETAWADTRAAYDAMDAGLRERIRDLGAYHSLKYSQSRVGHSHSAGSTYSGYGFNDDPPPFRPLVKVHPESGRHCLTIGRHAHAGGIDKDIGPFKRLAQVLIA